MSRINSIGAYFEKVLSGFTFGSQTEQITITGNVEIEGAETPGFEHSLQNKTGILAHLDDVNYLTGTTFNTGDGILTHSMLTGNTITVDLDGRYPLVGDLIPNTDDYVTSGSFNTGNGEVTLTRLSGGTVVYDLDGRYVTSVGGGVGIDSTGGLTPSISLNVSELGVSTMVTGDWIVFDNAGVSNKALISSIPLGIFNNDQGWTSHAAANDATITLSAGVGISGGSSFTTDQSSNNTITFNIDYLGTDNVIWSAPTLNNPSTADYIIYHDMTDNNVKKALVSSMPFNNNPAANDATITISAGTLLGGGGDFTTDQSGNETITINHDSVSRSDGTSSESPAHGGDFDVVDSVTTTAQGHLTAINVKTVTLPAGAVPNDATITIAAGIGLSTGGDFTTNQAGNETITTNFDANSLAVGGTLIATDHLVASNGTVSNKQLISSIPLGIFNNDQSWTSNLGTVTSVSGGNGLDSTGGTTPSLSLNFGELGVGGTLIATDYIIAENGGVENRQLISSIPLGIFNNDQGWTSHAAANNATITIGGGSGLLDSPGAFTTNQSGNETITLNVGSGTGITVNANDVAIDYLGTNNFIDSATNLEGTPISTADTIVYHDATDNNVKKGFVSDLPFTNSAAPNDATITITARNGLSTGGNFTTDQSSNETINIDIDYTGTDNFIDFATNLEGSAISTSDTIVYHDATDNNVKKGLISDLPFTNNSGDITRVDITAGDGLTGDLNTTSGDHIQTIDVDSTVVRTTGVQTITGQKTFSNSGNLELNFENTSAAVDYKNWDFVFTGTQWLFRAINDANSVASSYMVVTRAGTTISSIALNALVTAPDLTLTSLSNQASEATALMINGSNVVGTRELGSNAFNSTPIPGNTNITVVENATTVSINSSTGTDDSIAGATASLAGVVTNATQTFGGSKTFSNDLTYFGTNPGVNNEPTIKINLANAASPQITFTDTGDMTWAVGGDDADNSFKIHGNASAVEPIINGLAAPFFEIETDGQVTIGGQTSYYNLNVKDAIGIENISGKSELLFRNTTGTDIVNVSATDMIFKTTNTNRMRIEAGGDIWMGVSANRFKLSGDGVFTWGSTAAHGILSWDTGRAVVGALTGNYLDLHSNGSSKAKLQTNGELEVPAGVKTEKVILTNTSNVAKAEMVYNETEASIDFIFV